MLQAAAALHRGQLKRWLHGMLLNYASKCLSLKCSAGSRVVVRPCMVAAGMLSFSSISLAKQMRNPICVPNCVKTCDEENQHSPGICFNSFPAKLRRNDSTVRQIEVHIGSCQPVPSLQQPVLHISWLNGSLRHQLHLAQNIKLRKTLGTIPGKIQDASFLTPYPISSLPSPLAAMRTI